MSIVLQSTGGGQITLLEPTTASNFTQTLPAATGTAILANTSGDLQINSGFGSNATAYGCRAWVNFNGTGTPAIRASGNVSSITDNNTGDYMVNFTTAMPDANYIGVQSVERSSGNAIRFIAPYVQSKTTSTYRVTTTNLVDVSLDVTDIYVAIFR